MVNKNENLAIYGTETGPIPLDIEKGCRHLDKGPGFFNDYGFVVRAKTETGEDFHLWLFSYVVRGPEVIVEGDITQTLLVWGKFTDEEKKTIRDRPYVNKGQNLEDYEKPGTLTITESDGAVTWENAGRTYTGKPPIYDLGGVHAGVKVNLRFKENSKALFHHGRFEDAKPKSGDAGYLVHCDVTGSIEVNGEVLKIAKGYGVHERILTYGIVPERIDYMQGLGLSWAHGWSEEFSWYIMSGNGPMGKAYVNIDGDLVLAEGPKNAWVQDVDRWLDPKSRQVTPYKWRIDIITPKGRLDIEMTGFARAYYTWTRVKGTLVVNQFVADAVSVFTRTDGTVIKANQMASMEYMRTLYRQADY